jgi:hypothetical protein
MTRRPHQGPAHLARRRPTAERTEEKRADMRKYQHLSIERDVRGPGPGRGVSVPRLAFLARESEG